MTLLESKNGKIVRSDFPTKAQDVFDVSGAGDTVIASIAAGLASGFTLSDSIKLANIAAGIVVGKLGTSTVTQGEISPFFSDSHSHIEIQDIKNISKDLHTEEKRIVFTNGCFDILHLGHIDYLNKSAKLGTKLIIGLNSDESVRQIKGESRPIQDEISRANILAALNCVDAVVLFDEKTPQEIIKRILPNILVKGADYTVDEIVGAKTVLESGGQVQTIPFLEGYSSSSIINKIKNG